MIFSLLNIRKKTAAALAGIFIAIACLWGLAMWQDISRQEMLDILLATVIMVLVIAVCAVLLIVAFKMLGKLIRKILPHGGSSNLDSEPSTNSEHDQ